MERTPEAIRIDPDFDFNPNAFGPKMEFPKDTAENPPVSIIFGPNGSMYKEFKPEFPDTRQQVTVRNYGGGISPIEEIIMYYDKPGR